MGHSVDVRALQAKEQTEVMVPVSSSSPGCQHQATAWQTSCSRSRGDGGDSPPRVSESRRPRGCLPRWGCPTVEKGHFCRDFII